MNTRLQVEHTVTEMITGLDLVREQILAASGIATEYANVKMHGHAIQARICAEKSDGSYQPSTGEIVQYREPSAPVRVGSRTERHRVALEPSASVRVDTGIAVGSVVSGKYDNMLAKLIVHADNREAAIGLLDAKLSEYIINGIHTNIPLLQALLRDEKFAKVEHYTRYLQREFSPPQNDPELAASVAAILLYELEKAESARQFGNLAGFSNTHR